MRYTRPHPTLPKALTAVTLGVALFALCHGAVAQYSTNFDNLVGSESLSDQDGWLTNDEYTGSTYNPAPANASQARDIGQSDLVTTVDGFSSSATDQLAILGGALNQPGGAVPGSNPVYLYHSTNLPATATSMVFSTDMLVTPTGTTIHTAHDSFAFTFQNAQLSNLFSINFVPTSTTSNTLDNITYSVNGTSNTTGQALPLNARYHLVVSATITPVGGLFSAYIVPENGTGGENGTRVNLVTNQTYTGTIAELAATWQLASNTTSAATGTVPGDVPPTGNTNNMAYTGAGSNSLYFDNLSINLPEPSTYALLGAGAIGVAAALRRRRVA